MTCIVAIKNSKGVVMGADSCAGSGHRAAAVKTVKIAKVGEYLIGYTSSFRMGQILHHALSTTKHNEKNDILWHIVNVLIPELKSSLRSSGWLETNNGRDSGGEFILAHGNRIFVVQTDFSVLEYEEDFISVGCGEEWAVGALNALRKQKIEEKEKLQIALDTAQKFSSYVRAPFHFIQNY